MAEFQMSCMYCRGRILVEESYISMQIACPHCGRTLVVTREGGAILQYQRATLHQEAPQYQATPFSQGPQLYVKKQKGNNKSTASLVLGILGIIFFPIGFLLSLIGLIIGCAKKYTAGIVLGVIGLLLNILFTVTCVMAIMSAMDSAREKARVISCTVNMKQIGRALQSYMGCEMYFPTAAGEDGLDLLRSTGELTDLNVYKCPSSQNMHSYIYLGDGFEPYNSSSVPIVIELPKNHGGSVINVCYGDGSCRPWTIVDSMGIKNVRDLVKYLSKDLSTEQQERLLKNLERYGY